LASGAPWTGDDFSLVPCVLHGTGSTPETLYREALQAQRRIFGRQHPNVAVTLGNLAELLKDRRDYGHAEPLLRAAVTIDEQALGEEHPDTAQARSFLAVVLADSVGLPRRNLFF
jgi:hypothetical protein